METTYQLKGLDCPNCAMKIEKAVGKIDGVKAANVDYLNQKIAITCEEEQVATVTKEAAAVIKRLEPEVAFQPLSTALAKSGLESPEHGHLHSHDHGNDAGLHHGTLWRIGVSGVGLAILLVAPITGWFRIIGFFMIYLLIGGDILKKALTNLFGGEVFDENFLMTVATVGAMVIGEYPEAVLVMLLYQIGEFFQDFAVDRSRRNIKELMDVRPDTARRLVDGKVTIVSPNEVSIGELVLVNPGEKFPLDGVITSGQGYVDTAALTGESAPVYKQSGDEVLAGCINKEQQLTVQVTKNFQQSTVSKILELVENATSQKAPAEKFITKFARYYTPAVVALAVLLVAVPVIFFGGDFHEWLYRALTFLVISCPCALVISVPLSFFAGIGGASRAGVLIKGANYLETLAKVETVVFDKTGTLTEGKFAVSQIHSPLPDNEFLRYAAAVEASSNHPIAQSLVKAYGNGVLPEVVEMQELPGLGVSGIMAGKKVQVGNDKLLIAEGLPIPQIQEAGTIVHLVVAGVYQGYGIVSDVIKKDAVSGLQKLRQLGVKQLVMLTGDNPTVAASVAEKLGLEGFFAQLLPDDKVRHLESIKAISIGKVAFVGDGINDAPVLAAADIGIAMGGLGSDAAIEAADVVLMDDQPSKLATALSVSRKTLRIVKQNIIFALVVKVIVLALGAMGLIAMGWAVFADVGVTLIAVLNAMRCLKQTDE